MSLTRQEGWSLEIGLKRRGGAVGCVKAAPPGRRVSVSERDLGQSGVPAPVDGLAQVGAQCKFEYRREGVIGMLTACSLII